MWVAMNPPAPVTSTTVKSNFLHKFQSINLLIFHFLFIHSLIHSFTSEMFYISKSYDTFITYKATTLQKKNSIDVIIFHRFVSESRLRSSLQ